jgi:hypothetical protein
MARAVSNHERGQLDLRLSQAGCHILLKSNKPHSQFPILSNLTVGSMLTRAVMTAASMMI